MTNILEAISNIHDNPVFNILEYNIGRNRINSVGQALELFVKDAFANTLGEVDSNLKHLRYQENFSWLGNQNNPPDIIIRNGDSIEVKKTHSANSDLALNSSSPKAYITSDSSMIVEECRTCEDWYRKDIIYCVGHTSDTAVRSMWMVYGDIYAANPTTYDRIKRTISVGVNGIPDVEFAETTELGRVNRVDPLGITNLRIRGMWSIRNPRRVFENHYSQSGSDFELVAIMKQTKYRSFPENSRNRLESRPHVNISDIKVENPNNPCQLFDCKLIVFAHDAGSR